MQNFENSFNCKEDWLDFMAAAEHDNPHTNDYGDKQDFYMEVTRLLKIEGLKYERPMFWINAYDQNILPSDAVKFYLKVIGVLQ